MLRNRSIKGKEGKSSSMRAWLNAAGGPGFWSNDMWAKGVSAELVSRGASIFVCWLVVPGRLLRTSAISFRGSMEEGLNLFVSSSGVLADRDKESSIISEGSVGLDIEIVCPSFELGFCG